jgi:hypothetical protein
MFNNYGSRVDSRRASSAAARAWRLNRGRTHHHAANHIVGSDAGGRSGSASAAAVQGALARRAEIQPV